MSIGQILLSLNLNDKEFKSSMNRAVNQFNKTVNTMKNLLIAAKLGSFLFSGAAQQAQEELKQVQTALSAMADGFSADMIRNLQPIIEQVDYLGVAADQASDILYKFILTGRSMGLQQMGIYLDKDTQAMLAAADAATRYQGAIENIPGKIQDVQNALSPTTQAFFEFKKKADDVKKALGTAFMGVLLAIVNAFGGVTNVMKTAIIAFTAYKTAMILGNVGIGISKAIAMGSVFSAPIAIGMGVAALGAISALIGGAAIAVNALNNIPDPNANMTTTPTPSTNSSLSNQKETIIIVKDKFGETSKLMAESSGGGSSSIQTNYGSKGL